MTGRWTRRDYTALTPGGRPSVALGGSFTLSRVSRMTLPIRALSAQCLARPSASVASRPGPDLWLVPTPAETAVTSIFPPATR